MFRVRAIQVDHGDSLLVSYGSQERPFHLLIDGGPSGSLTTLLDVLRRARVDGRLRLEALIVTHYDLDHIQGIIELLTEIPSWLEIRDVWFNGHHHLAPEDTLGPGEGDTLSKLIRNKHLPWNVEFRRSEGDVDGGPVEQSVKGFTLDGDLWVNILSPDAQGLQALAQKWPKADLPPDDSSSTPSDLLGRGDEWPPRAFSRTRVGHFHSDTSVPNRSSIALLLTYGKKRALLAADAFSDVVKAGLALHLRAGEAIDLLKVSHHGSKGNTDRQLLDVLGCNRFLISTSGSRHKHPDHDLIERLVADYNDPEIIFNYGVGWPANWHDIPISWPSFRATYPEPSNPFVDVLL